MNGEGMFSKRSLNIYKNVNDALFVFESTQERV
jgi:hypothetical protein